MRRTGSPSIVTADGKQHSLARVAFSDRSVAEEFLQRALDGSPQMLPIEDIDPAFGPIVSVGREIDNIDNLFISPSGRIALVETKLWRNPEATREVVAQVLDYATRLSSWSYSRFEEELRRALPPAPLGSASLYDFIAQKHPDQVLPEAQFIDEVQRNLRAARFLLLVVGDGIRENLESMLGYLHRQPQMLFTFGLVEMQIYESPDLFSGQLLLPMLVAQTTEVVRAVVRVQTTGQASVEVSIEESDESKPASGRRTLNEELFFAELPDNDARTVFRDILDFAVDLGAVPAWRSSGVSIQLPDPGGSDKRLTLFVMTTGGDVYTGWLGDQLGTVGLDADMGYDYVRAVAALVPGVTQSLKKPDNLSRSIKSWEFRKQVDAFKHVVRDTVGKIQEAQP